MAEIKKGNHPVIIYVREVSPVTAFSEGSLR